VVRVLVSGAARLQGPLTCEARAGGGSCTLPVLQSPQLPAGYCAAAVAPAEDIVRDGSTVGSWAYE
jgi:hypothetical protein